MSTVAISVPFRFSSEVGAGGVATVSDESAVWRDRVYVAVLTLQGERVMRPEYGSLLALSEFENEANAISLAQESIVTVFTQWLSQLTLIDSNVVFDRESSQVIITVEYVLPSGKPDQTTFRTGTFNRYGDLLREGV